MKKSIVIITLLLVTARSVYGGKNQTWGQWLDEMLNSYQYHSMPIDRFNSKRLYFTPNKEPISSSSHPYGELSFFSPTNPIIHHYYARKDGKAEIRTLTLPVKELAIAAGAYLAGRWAWNKFMMPEIKKIENKVNQLSKLNDQLINQIKKAENNPKATPEEKAVLNRYKEVFETIKESIAKDK